MASTKTINQARALSSLPVILQHLNYCSFSAQFTTPARPIFENLRQHPDYPGVIVLDGRNCLGVISRQRCFEQLGQPFGVEIFLRRHLQVLFEKVFYPAQALTASTTIEQAVQMVLHRPMDQVYEPVLMLDSSKKPHLIDFHDLLLAHSRLLVHASRVVKSQLQIEQSLFSVLEWDPTLQQVFDLLRQIVPYDRVVIFLEITGRLKPIASIGFDFDRLPAFLRDDGLETMVYQEIQHTRSPLLNMGLESVRDLSQDMNLPFPKAWLGLPLMVNEQVAGMFALSRLNDACITQDEITMAMNFSNQAGIALQNACRFEWKSQLAERFNDSVWFASKAY